LKGESFETEKGTEEGSTFLNSLIVLVIF